MIKSMKGSSVMLWLLVTLQLSCSTSSSSETRPASADVIINEIVAVGSVEFVDEDGEPSDWIELLNRGDQDVSLDGWFLSDDEEIPRKWGFPAITIAAGEYLVVFASGKDRKDDRAQPLHTNFKLKASGEYLALRQGGDVDVLKTEFAPSYPPQFRLASYGRATDDSLGFLSPPTPGASNATSDLVQPSDLDRPSVSFTPTSGVFIDTVEVTISGTGTLRYTLDGSVPTIESPTISEPLVLNRSTLVRVGVELDGRIDEVVTGTFIGLAPELRDRTSNLPLVVIDAFGDERIDDVERPRQFRTVASAVFELDATTQRSSLSSIAAFVGRGGLHIRGNSTAEYDKKQYSFETWDESGQDMDVSLLGLPAESDWVLHAPFADKTLMRNHLMYQWSNRIGRYASRTRFIELYLNKEGEMVDEDDYVGVYVLMEKVKRGSQRVDVESQSAPNGGADDLTGGYILEKGWDFSERVGLETQEFGDQLLFSYPDADDISTSQRAYLQQYFDDFEQALVSDDFADLELGYARFIDVDSFIDHHLLNEFARNVDGFVLSTYLHKRRGGKVQMGPIWDFNGALGNPDYFEGWLTEGWHHENPEFPADNPNAYKWYERLMEDGAFRERYRERWRELRSQALRTDALMADIDAAANVIGESVARNFERWDILGSYVWPNAEGFDERDSYGEEIAYLKAWIQARVAWMDSQLADDGRRADLP